MVSLPLIASKSVKEQENSPQAQNMDERSEIDCSESFDRTLRRHLTTMKLETARYTLKETWKAKYICKFCLHAYTHMNNKNDQKRMCLKCRKMNSPDEELGE